MALTPEQLMRLQEIQQARAMQAQAAPIQQPSGGLTPEQAARLAEIQAYKKQMGAKPAEPIVKTVQEMHPDVSTADRLVIKNFAQSPEKGLQYLKSKLPSHDMKLVDGEIKLRRPGETEYRVVDPDTGFFSSDFVNDVGDVGYDVAAAGVETAATTAGAVGGAIAGLGVGSVPGALVGGAAAGAGSAATMEALRQKLGRAAGIDQEVDGTDVAISGGLGLASPLLMGTNNAAKYGVKELLKRGLAKNADEAAGMLEKSGAIGTAWKGAKAKVFPKVGNFMSGVSEDSLVGYADEGVQKAVDTMTPESQFEKVSNLSRDLLSIGDEAKEKATINLVDEMDSLGDGFDAREVISVIDEKIAALSNKKDITPSDKAIIDRLTREKNKYFQLVEPRAKELKKTPEMLAEEEMLHANLLKTQAEEAAPKVGGGIVDALEAGKSANKAELEAIEAAKPKTTYEPSQDQFLKDLYERRLKTDGADKAREAVQSIEQNIPAIKTELEKLNAAMAEKASVQKSAKVAAIVKRLKEINTPEMQEYIEKMTGRDFWEKQKVMKPLANYGKDMTPEDHQLVGTFRAVNAKFNKVLNDASNKATGKVKAEWNEARELQNLLKRKFGGRTEDVALQKTLNEITNLDKSSRAILSAKLAKVLGNEGKSKAKQIDEAVKILKVHKELGGNSGLASVSSGGTTSTSRNIPLAGIGTIIGGSVGYKTTGDGTGAAVGGAAGAGLGSVIGGKAAMKAYIKAAMKTGKARDKAMAKLPKSLKDALRVQVGQELGAPVGAVTGSLYGAIKAKEEKSSKGKR